MEYWFMIISGVLATLYIGLILVYRYWFNALKPFQVTGAFEPTVFFSIIIPARNELDNIEKCIQSILAQSYPLYEIIVVDDHSTDDTPLIVAQLAKQYPQVQLIYLKDYLGGKATNAFKKKAIEIAVDKSKGDWIVTTDADCLVPPNWLYYFNAMILAKDPVFIAAPVMFTQNGRFSGIFQVLDFLSLQGITAAAVSAGSHSMCNGANLAYSKTAFEAVGKFKGIDHLASGDDMLLMHKMKTAFPGRLAYLFSNEMIVKTAPMPNWTSFIQQRIRWASKADSYNDQKIFGVLLLVYLFNASLLIGLLVGIFSNELLFWTVWIIAIKTLIELYFLLPVAQFFKLEKTLVFFPIMQPFHIVYTVIAGWLGKFGKYQWKNRTVN
ncbi:glycosyltransferase [Sediminibacterium sp.]|uniref:glycosyltransferase n=1 Tax=Sediminibacterium sp. TaxID=1917865 RepID=UPI00273400B0|nr:glycosyltransferase [Sediminibacterium sp.]MDP3393452.1 glycosyltransferase [Sediminibacterium sp.]MDP3568054.1 glycosyltransferase [Sediminibacterium sp.]